MTMRTFLIRICSVMLAVAHGGCSGRSLPVVTVEEASRTKTDTTSGVSDGQASKSPQGASDKTPPVGSAPADKAPELAEEDLVPAGPAWFEPGWFESIPMAFSGDGEWYAAVVSGGVVIGRREDWRPVAALPLAIDKSNGIAFHPTDQYLVLAVDFSVSVWALHPTEAGLAVTQDTPLPAVDVLWTHPPIFDAAGRILALMTSQGADIYDFAGRRLTAHVSGMFETSPAEMGIHGDRVTLIQTESGACECDDFGGSDSLVTAWRIGDEHPRDLPLSGDLESPVSLQGDHLATRNGVWDLRTGKRKRRWPGRVPSPLQVLRMKRRAATVAVSGKALKNGKYDYIFHLLKDKGPPVRLASISDEINLDTLSTPPNEDAIVCLNGAADPPIVTEIPLNGDPAYIVALPTRLCIDGTEVVPDERCDGRDIHPPLKIEEAVANEEVPYRVPEKERPKGPEAPQPFIFDLRD